jgi:predicted PurR-regulated permease PerM
LYKLAPLVVLTAFAILLAVTLQPLRRKMARFVPLWLATTVISLSLIGAVAIVLGVLVPEVVSQLTAVTQQWPRIQADIFRSMPERTPVRTILQQIFTNPGLFVGKDVSKELPRHLLTFGGMALGGLSSLVLMFTLSVYVLVEGRRTIAWILAFFKPETRFKLHQTMREVGDVISAYVGGQFITSLLVAFYAGILLTALKVPGALLLSLLAGLLDVLPIVGFVLSILPATLLALTVSARAAILVASAYIVYHAVENYFIVPLIYGNKLRLSTLAVLMSLLAGAMIGGIPGALLSLPIAASYPIIERIWLRRYVGSDVIEKHWGSDDGRKKIS